MPDSNVPTTNQITDTTSMSKAERKKLQREERHHQREQAAQTQQRKQLIKKTLIWTSVVGAVVLVGWLIIQSLLPNPDLISRRGIHWHADLAISIKGQPVEIPADIGMGTVHADMHTHKVNDQLHVEMQRPVRKEDIRLGNFFDIWGKPFTSTCILDSCNGSDGTIKMLVNGEENKEFENYLVQDKDKIEIRYE